MTTAKGGQPLAGSVKWLPNKRKPGTFCWHGRFTLPDGKRTKFVRLDTNIGHGPCCDVKGSTCEHVVAARAASRVAAQVVRATGGTPDVVKETTREWFKRFHTHKEGRGLATVPEMRGRYTKWIDPEVGNMDPRAVTPAHLESIVRRLDRAIESWIKHEGKRGVGRISPSTAANVWGDLVHAFDEMVCSKDPSLRALSVSPCANVRGPEAGDDRQGQILYSDELLALLRGAPHEADAKPVPLYRRQVYAMACYTKTRASELEALTAADVDFPHGTITIDRQVDRKSKGRTATKRTKTRNIRVIDIEPNVLPLVKALVETPAGKGKRLLHMPPPEDRAELLRRDLWTVGVRRDALHKSNELQRAIVLHDMRDTGLTHMAVRGDSPVLIQWAAGHTDMKTTSGYIERGKVEARRIGHPLPPLPEGLFPGPIGSGSVRDYGGTETANYLNEQALFATPTGIEPVLPT